MFALCIGLGTYLAAGVFAAGVQMTESKAKNGWAIILSCLIIVPFWLPILIYEALEQC